MKTKQTVETVQNQLMRQHLASLEIRVDKIGNRLDAMESTGKQALKVCRDAHEKVTTALEQVKPIKGQPSGAALEVDTETKRQMAAQAQFLNLRGPDELAQIVLHAFLEMCEEDNWITFPLMLQQVETV